MSTRMLRCAGFAALASLALVETASAYYDPRTGRFISRDPIGEPGAMLVRHGSQGGSFIPRDIGVSEEPHAYAYTLNEPVGRVDALGLKVTANPRCHLFQDCSDCWQTCQQNQHLFGPGVAGLAICRDDGCMCACANNSFAPSGPPGNDQIKACVLHHEEWHIWHDPDNACDCRAGFPCTTVGPPKSECGAYKAEARCLCGKLRECHGNQSCIAKIKRRITEIEQIASRVYGCGPLFGLFSPDCR